MRNLIAIVFLGAISAAGLEGPAFFTEQLADGELNEGFYPLFNGHNLDGWWIRGEKPVGFTVRDGVLAVEGVPGSNYLFTDDTFANFVLRYEYRCVSDAGNSGVAIRAPREGDPAYTGMEIQVLRPDWPTQWQRAGALYASVGIEEQHDNPFGEWNSVEVLADGPRIRTTMNGHVYYDILTTDFTEDKDWCHALVNRSKVGHIGFQNHGSKVEFRHVRIKPLPGGPDWNPLFNRKNLDGWTAIGDALFTVTDDSVLRVDGAGMTQRSELRTNDTFRDFELRLAFRPHDHANSGVFFRGSGDLPWPDSYEVQIDNHNPRQFTGAVWDQVPAKELRAFENAWNHMQITARGDHIQVWVNGKTVCDYFSARHEQHPEGWISLQAHDPNSVVDFKDIEIRVLPTDAEID